MTGDTVLLADCIGQWKETLAGLSTSQLGEISTWPDIRGFQTLDDALADLERLRHSDSLKALGSILKSSQFDTLKKFSIHLSPFLYA